MQVIGQMHGGVPQSEIKKQQQGMGVMVNTVFPEDLSLDPSSHVGRLRT